MLSHTVRISFELSNRCNYAPFHKRCPLNTAKETIILSSKIVRKVFDSLGGWAGIVAFHTYNEPLIDPRLFTFIEMARGNYIYILTNGYYLNQSLAQELEEAGAKAIETTAYSESEMLRLSKIKIAIPYIARRSTLDRRLEMYDKKPVKCNKPCAAPLNEIIVGCDGCVRLCCYDWKGMHNFGNLYHSELEDVIKEMKPVFDRLIRGERHLYLCQRCDKNR